MIKSYRREENGLQAELVDNDEPAQDIQERLTETQRIRAETEKRVKALRSKLGIDGRLNLLRLAKDKYLQLRMNASSLRTRIVQRSRERKFELERLQRSYRNALNGKQLYSYCYHDEMTHLYSL